MADEGLEDEKGGGKREFWRVRINSELFGVPWEKTLELLEEAGVAMRVV